MASHPTGTIQAGIGTLSRGACAAPRRAMQLCICHVSYQRNVPNTFCGHTRLLQPPLWYWLYNSVLDVQDSLPHTKQNAINLNTTRQQLRSPLQLQFSCSSFSTCSVSSKLSRITTWLGAAPAVLCSSCSLVNTPVVTPTAILSAAIAACMSAGVSPMWKLARTPPVELQQHQSFRYNNYMPDRRACTHCQCKLLDSGTTGLAEKSTPHMTVDGAVQGLDGPSDYALMWHVVSRHMAHQLRYFWLSRHCSSLTCKLLLSSLASQPDKLTPVTPHFVSIPTAEITAKASKAAVHR